MVQLGISFFAPDAKESRMITYMLRAMRFLTMVMVVVDAMMFLSQIFGLKPAGFGDVVSGAQTLFCFVPFVVSALITLYMFMWLGTYYLLRFPFRRA